MLITKKSCANACYISALIKEIVHPKIKWHHLFKTFMTFFCGTQMDWMIVWSKFKFKL